MSFTLPHSIPSSRLLTGLGAAALTLLSVGCAMDGGNVDSASLPTGASGPADAPGAAGVVIAQIEDLTVVDCLLPGRLRKMGQTITWVGRPRAVKQTVSDCEILGGQYVLFDRTNYDTALAVWRVAADQGDPTAQTYVGEIFERGLGRAPDYGAAAQWYRKAATQGFPRAQFRLGALYEKGLGVQRDPVEALEWYRRAAGLTRDKVVYLSQALAEGRQQGASMARRPSTEGRGSAPRTAPESAKTGAEEKLATRDEAARRSPPLLAEPAPAAPPVQGQRAGTQPAQAQSQAREIAAAARSMNQELTRAEAARDRAHEAIVMRSHETRLMDQAKPGIRADRRLIDQYVALTQEAETQRIAAESLERVLGVAAPVTAQY